MVIKAVVAYDGHGYCGWQVQPGLRTIQGEIERVIKLISKQSITIVGSGRTDAKVHAMGQVFHFECDMKMKPEDWLKAMNRLLPKDIRIMKCEMAEADFHARFSAVKKRYDYYITHEVDNPFIQNYMAKDSRRLDVEKMRECAKVFIGTHDFTSFTSNKIHEEKSRVRTIEQIQILDEGNCVHFIFVGDGFLRYQIRMMVQTLIEAGKHRLDYEQIALMLEAKDKHACRYKADACGLYLVEVFYE